MERHPSLLDNAAIPAVALSTEDQDAFQLGADCTAVAPGIRNLARLRHRTGGGRPDRLYRRTDPLPPVAGPWGHPLAALLCHPRGRSPGGTRSNPRRPATHLS